MIIYLMFGKWDPFKIFVFFYSADFFPMVWIMKNICKLLKILQDKTIFYVIEKFSFLSNN